MRSSSFQNPVLTGLSSFTACPIMSCVPHKIKKSLPSRDSLELSDRLRTYKISHVKIIAMNKEHSERYRARDGIVLEIAHHRAPREKKVLIVWPCTGGAFQMYRAPVSSFTERGISVVLFNPPGHGSSGGERNYKAAIHYLTEYLHEHVDSSLEHIFAGHSGGAGAVLVAAPDSAVMKKFFLVSPVLDSRESLFFMYRKNTIHEFNMLIASLAVDKKKVLEILSVSKWMDPVIWQKRGYRELLDGISGANLIGNFLENLFIQGFNTFEELKKHREHCRILLASNDNWYCHESIEVLAGENNIPITVMKSARDHYFTGAWPEVWKYILHESSPL